MWVGTAEEVLKVRGHRSSRWPDRLTCNGGGIHFDRNAYLFKYYLMYLFAGMLTRLTRTRFRIQCQSQGQGQGRCILKDLYQLNVSSVINYALWLKCTDSILPYNVVRKPSYTYPTFQNSIMIIVDIMSTLMLHSVQTVLLIADFTRHLHWKQTSISERLSATFALFRLSMKPV